MANAISFERLVKKLGHAKPQIRSEAVTALRTTADPRLADLFVTFALSDSGARYRESRGLAILYLGQIHAISAIEPLFTILNDEQDDHLVREQAAQSLGAIGDSRVLPRLFDAVHNPNKAVRAGALYALASFTHPHIIDELITALADPEPHVRYAAAYALTTHTDKRAILPLITALYDANFFVGGWAVNALVKIGDAAIPPLLEALHSANPPTQRWAAEALGKLNVGDAVAPLLTYIQSDQVNHATQEEFIRALGNIDGAAVHDVFLHILADTTQRPSLRALIANTIGELHIHEAVPQLLSYIGDPKEDQQLRAAAAAALGLLGDTCAVEPLLRLLQTDGESGYVLHFVVRALGELGDRSAVQPLITKLTELGWLEKKNFFGKTMDRLYRIERPNVIAEALGNLGDKAAVVPLLFVLRHHCTTNSEMAGSVIEALGKLGDPHVIAELEKFQNDSEHVSHWGMGPTVGNITDAAIQRIKQNTSS